MDTNEWKTTENTGQETTTLPDFGQEQPVVELITEKEAPEVTSEITAMRAERETQEKAVQEASDRYLRTLADFDNYKKRVKKEQEERARFANERLLSELLPLMDNLERALAHAKESPNIETLVEGFDLIRKQTFSTLEKFGIKPIESLNQPFDPCFHQAVGSVEVEGEEQENKVIQEAQQGYLLYDRVLRPSLVMVSKKKVIFEAGIA